jgi:hypothetical protein
LYDPARYGNAQRSGWQDGQQAAGMHQQRCQQCQIQAAVTFHSLVERVMAEPKRRAKPRRSAFLFPRVQLVLAYFLAEKKRKPSRHANDKNNHEQAEQAVVTRKQQIPSHHLPPV